MAHAHAGNFQQMKGVALASCLDVNAERAKTFAEKFGFKKVATDFDGLLADCDAISVVTPDALHAQQSLAILRAGKHLLCEKPLTISLEEAKEVAEAARKASEVGVIHMTNFSYRGSAGFQKAIELRESGVLGHIRHVSSFYLQEWLAAPIWGHWSNEGFLWRLDKRTSGGVLGDVGCHILDMTTAIAGDVKRVRCELRTFEKVYEGQLVSEHGGKNLDANDSAVIEVEFSNGAFGVVQTTRWATGHANHLRCEVHGTEGVLSVDLDRNWNGIDTMIGEKALMKAKWKSKDLKPTPSNYERFIKSIKTGRQDQPDIVRGAEVQAILHACEQSSVSGKWELVPSI